MKKALVFAFIFLVILGLSISCENTDGSIISSVTTDASAIDDSIISSVTIDASAIDDILYAVGKKTIITIENMEKDKMYAVKVEGQNSRSLSSRGAITNENVFYGGGNSWIPIPDDNGMSSFTANEIEINGKTDIKLVLLRDGSDDFTIKESEDPVSCYNDEGDRVYEEYYHIDFSQEPYNQLDKGRISLRTLCTGSGGGIGVNWGYVTIDAGGIKPEGYTAGLYDFSDKEFVNLYNSLSIRYSTSPMASRLLISNPIPCNIDEAATIRTVGSVMSFIPPEKGKEYVLDLNKKEGVYYSDDFNLRYIDGQFHNFTFPIDDDTYYIGKLDSEIVVDITASAGGLMSDDYGSVTFREANESEIEEYNRHFVTIDKDEYEFFLGKTGYDYSESVFFVQDENGKALEDYEMTSEFLYEDGSYVEGYCEVYYNSKHSYGVGYSGVSVSGSYGVYQPDNDDLLQKFSIRVLDSEPVNVKITFRKKQPIKNEDFLNCNLFVVENHGAEIKVEKIPSNGTYTIPKLEKEGYEYEGMYYKGTLYKAGEQVVINNLYSAITAAWTPRAK